MAAATTASQGRWTGTPFSRAGRDDRAGGERRRRRRRAGRPGARPPGPPGSQLPSKRRLGSPPGPGHPLRAAGRGAAARKHRRLEGAADPGLGRQRVPGRRVPLPGLPLRRPRRARQRPRPGRPPRRQRPCLAALGHVHLSDGCRLRGQRRRPRRAAREAAGFGDRVSHHAQHAQGPHADRRHDRDRRLTVATPVSARRQRFRSGAILPDRPRRHGRADRRRRRSHARRRHPRLDRHAEASDRASRAPLRLGPGSVDGQALGRRRPLGQAGGPLPDPAAVGGCHPRRRRHAGAGAGVLQRRVPLPGGPSHARFLDPVRSRLLA